MNGNNNNSNLFEVYSAIQGEGPLVGIRQIFVRFSGCDLRCIWCDTPLSLNKTKTYDVEISPGERKFKQYNNPVSVDELIKLCAPLIPSMHHSLAVTGGEPLLQSKFLELFLPEFKKIFNIPIYLETGGHRPNELLRVIKQVDYISMDFKLQSSASCGDLWNKHFEFLKISVQSNAKTWVKIVTTDRTDLNELEYALNNIKSIVGNKNGVEVILQPVTPINNVMPVSETVLLDWQKSLIKIFPSVRVIPQTHKLIGQK